MLGAQLRKLPGFVRANRAVTKDDAHPSSGILTCGVKLLGICFWRKGCEERNWVEFMD